MANPVNDTLASTIEGRKGEKAPFRLGKSPILEGNPRTPARGDVHLTLGAPSPRLDSRERSAERKITREGADHGLRL